MGRGCFTTHNIINLKINKNKVQALFHILLSLILILSIIQIIPDEIKVIGKASASSTWTQDNWSKPNSYISYEGLNIINNTGDLKLHYGEIIYVLDKNNHRIVKTMLDGGIWKTYGTYGFGTGNFNSPMGFYYDSSSEYFYISDSANHRIIKTKWGSKNWTTYGTRGSGVGNFLTPMGIHFDSSSGFIYVADRNNCRIVKTMINGSGWTTYGSFGLGTGNFWYPSDLYYDNTSGFIYVSDSSNERIVKTKIDGSGWITYGTYGNGTGQFYGPGSITYDNTTGYIYASDWGNDRLVKTLIDGSGWTTYGSQGSGTGQFYYPWGIHYDKKTGNIYVADSGNGRIVRTTIYGSGWKAYGSQGSGTGQFKDPIDIALVGNRYCADGFLKSKKFDMNGSAELLTIKWTAVTPKHTSVKIQIRTAENKSALNLKSFVGPNGSANRFYNRSGSKVWLGHSGDGWVQYKAILSTDAPQKTPILKDVTIEYNLLPNRPRIISPDDNHQTNDNRIAYTWEHVDIDSSGQAGYQWQMDDNKEFESVNYDSKKISSALSLYKPINPIADGIWYWRVKTKDTDNGWSTFSKPRKILIDTQKPTSEITVPKNDTYCNDLNYISGIATDPDICSGINKTEIAIKRLEDDKYWNSDYWVIEESWNLVIGHECWWYNTSNVALTSGSTYIIKSRSWDNVTNVEIPSEGIIFGFDTEDPVSNIEFPLDNSSYNKVSTISGTSMDFGGSGLNHVEIAIKKISNSKYWDGDSWEKERSWLNAKGTNIWTYNARKVPWASGKEYLILSRATDIVDNIETPTDGNMFLYDADKPSSIIEFPKDNSYLNQVESIYGNATDIGGSCIEKVEISIIRINNGQYWSGKSWDLEKQWLTAEGTDEWTFNSSEVEWVSDKYYTVSSRVTDNAENIESSWRSVSFMFDNTPPGQSFTINGDSEFTNNSNVELSLDFWDSGSGVVEMSFKNDEEDWTLWESINFSKSFNLTSGNGAKYVSFRVKDRVGNIGKPISKPIILDTTPPDGSVLINNGDMFTNNNIVTLSLSGIDDFSNINGMSFSSDMLFWSYWEPFNPQKNFSFSSGDGKKIVYYRVRDGAGNAGIFSDIIFLDSTPPHSLSITIYNGASETKSTKISLNLTAIDDLSGVGQMSFCTQGEQWSSWEEFKETMPYELSPGNGQKIILFRVRDNAGNVAIPISGVINLNIETPEQDGKEKGTVSYFYLWVLLIIIIIIIILFAVLISRRKRKLKQEAEAKTVGELGVLPAKPVEVLVSMPTTDKLTPVSKPPELPLATGTVAHVAAKQLTTKSDESQHLPQIKPAPQLPPALQQNQQPTQIQMPGLTPEQQEKKQDDDEGN